ncbi:type II toxin-antitoxin system RelB/DinJ family antitoxin [Bartonella schoenbuchensis]|uniref:DNA-damage-inducible protein n=2 Tax=Bartonella schoenbuchensis TaxID=165694 RepID=E6YZ18_BARSR|nr:type II toxin-antitoxin system RelB/DinJ family antitoxin [Bartonella schoenbuchensis]AQX30210.1 DNA-damage-inducible protein J [Bartonella schoenbuchensis R1]CBI81758.1 DNA-damage-inducible protein [Bartonella schoenbuchensis R1]CDP80386.1 DNA-damage-inducible protein J [Bartonella schoenbuchensis]
MGKIQARIPDEIQEIASAVIKSTGLTVSDAVRMFMTGVARNKALPLDLFQPNLETLQAIEDAETGRVERTSLNGLRDMIRSDKAEVYKSAKQS